MQDSHRLSVCAKELENANFAQRGFSQTFSSGGTFFVHAARTIARSTIGRAILQIVACATPGVNAFACAAVGAGLTLAAGGTLKQAFIGAAISFVQMGAYAGIHQAIGGIANATVAAVAKVGLHAVVGGAVSMAQGGSFETGALTGAVAAGSSLLMDSSGVMGHSGDGNPEYIAERTAVSAIAGGTASVLSGGKFANGAITGAFAQLYNAECIPCKGITGPEMGRGSRIGAIQGGGGAVGIGLGAWMSTKLSGAWDAFSSWAMAPADVAGGSGEGDRVEVFRAINSEELNYLQTFGNYGYSPSQAGKYFALTMQGAKAYSTNSWMQDSVITATTVPSSIIKQGFYFNDPGPTGAGPSLHYQDSQLPLLYKSMSPVRVIPE
mgnify:CR=1 FL=1